MCIMMFFENAIKNTLVNRQLSDLNISKWFQDSLFFFFEIIGDNTSFLTVKTNFFFYVSTIIIVKHTSYIMLIIILLLIRAMSLHYILFFCVIADRNVLRTINNY